MSASTRSGAAPTEPELTWLYRATAAPQVVDVPDLTFLMIDGHGDPNTSPAYAEAVQALYAVSYAVKFAIKRSGGTDHKVAPLEGLWWALDMTDFSMERKSNWDWPMMIRQPGEATPDLVARTAEETAAKKRIPAARDLRLQIYAEGRAAQVLHVGPYAAEAPTIAGCTPSFPTTDTCSTTDVTSTTRSTSATRAERAPTGSRRSSGNPSPRLPPRPEPVRTGTPSARPGGHRACAVVAAARRT
jgi:hypothetical protein